MIKCARQSCDKGSTCALILNQTKNFGMTHVAFLRRVLTNPLEYGDAIVLHDSGLQILAGVSVTFHNALGRSVVDSASFFVNETSLEQHVRATETFGARSDASV